MGVIMDTDDEHFGVEDRRESIIFSEKKENAKAKHIFDYGDGVVEISKEFLKKMMDYLNAHPKIVENWEEKKVE